MSRHPSSTQYLTPIKGTDGSDAVPASDPALGSGTNPSARGVYTLTANTAYFVMLGAQDSVFVHLHLQGDAEIVVTSATVEESDLADAESSNTDTTTGTWLPTPNTLIESAKVGTGWNNTNDVGSAAGGNAGGVTWNISNWGGRRMRLNIAVGATGGQVRLATWSKE